MGYQGERFGERPAQSGRWRRLFLLLTAAIFLTGGCEQELRLVSAEKYGPAAGIDYATYLYASGLGGRWRAAFLKSPDSPVEVVPYAPEIVTAVGTYDEALLFMKQAIGYRSIDVQAVEYKGRLVGYLLTRSTDEMTKNLLVVDVYADGGKVYFKVREIIESTD